MKLTAKAKKISLIAVVLLSNLKVVAAELVTAAPAAVTVEKKFSMLTNLEFSQQVSVGERSERESGTDLLLSPSYKMTEALTVAARTVISKSNTGPRDTTLSNSTLSLSIRGTIITPQITSLHSLGAVIPTNKESQKSDRLITSANLSNGLRFELGFARLDYRLGLTKNVHEFTLNAAGSPNIEYRLASTLDVSVPLTERWSLNSTAIYRQGRTYRGFERASFEWHNDVNWDLTPTFAINAGVSNDGSAQKANGVDSNIGAYNPNSSTTRAGFSYNY